MRIVPFDDLTDRQHADRALLSLAAFGVAVPRTLVEKRRRVFPEPEYVSLHAVDRDRVVGQLSVVRFPYAFREGIETVAGLAALSTHPGRARTGIARSLLAEAHAREEGAGIRHVTLWTNASWGAYRLYQELGYRDVYSSPWAVRPPRPAGDRPARVRGAISVRPGRPRDAGFLEELHQRFVRDRLGFRRAPGRLRLQIRLGELSPPRDLLVAVRDRKPVGYAHLSRTPFRTICDEVVAESPAVRRALVDAVARVAEDGVVAFQHSVVADHPELFPPREWARSPVNWWRFLARDRGRPWRPADAVRRFATTDPAFLCQGGDRF